MSNGASNSTSTTYTKAVARPMEKFLKGKNRQPDTLITVQFSKDHKTKNNGTILHFL